MTYEFENQYRAEGYKIICGVDEAGRGPLAGPVYAAAVILPDGLEDLGINDSKKMSEKKREQLFDVIVEHATAYGVGFATETEIDEINILNATFLAMKRAVEAMGVEPDLVLVDGNRKPNTGFEEVTIVKGDAKSISIAAASILAKVSRDRYMRELAEKYPEYEFDRHKGYGTKLHYEKIEQYGILPDHRKSFLKDFEQMIAEPRRTGLLGEMRAAQYLRHKGYNIWSANYRTKAGEIDIIADDGHFLCFVEVKTRREGSYFPPSDAVDYKKEENVRSAAASYVSASKVKMPVRFDIIEVILREDTYSIRHIKNAF